MLVKYENIIEFTEVFMLKILQLLDSKMTTPTNYNWFHIMFIAIVIITTFLLCKFFKDSDKKTFNKIILISWIIILVLEIYKQFVFSYTISENTVSWDYQWYAFPFQFCSSPLYVLPFILLVKNDKIKEMFIAFTATFCFFGGLVVYIYPNDVFIETIGINFQTMIHHGLQIVLGIYCITYYRNSLNFKWWSKSIFVFAGLVATALSLNVIVYHVLQNMNINETFNMFYISPYFDCTLPVLSIFYGILPYILFLLLYIIGFSLAAFIIYLLQQLIINYIRKKELKNA